MTVDDGISRGAVGQRRSPEGLDSASAAPMRQAPGTPIDVGQIARNRAQLTVTAYLMDRDERYRAARPHHAPAALAGFTMTEPARAAAYVLRRMV